MKKNILIDYRIPDTKKYLGNSFPPLIYEYLRNNSQYNVYNLSSKNIPNIDILLVINGGSHWTYKDLTLNNIHFNQVIKWLYPKIKKYLIWLGFFFGLHRLYFYQRHLFRNRSYEKHFDQIIKKNPNIKIIHRLDGSYQTICKVYGYDKTVKYINDKADLTIHQSNYSKEIWENDNTNIFGKAVKLNPKKSMIINNSVNINIFKPKSNFIKKNKIWKIIHVSASSNPKKGLYKILELAHSLKNNSTIEFILTGKQIYDPVCGSDLKYFKNVKYIGHQTNRNQLAELYRSCDILFFPSQDDCSPNVVLEAMSSGLPVLTIDSGGIKELIYKKDNLRGGIFIDEDNPVIALDFLIKNYEKYSSNAIEIIKKYHNEESTLVKYNKVINMINKNL